MDLQETMRELESLGSEQTRKTLLRHGAPEPLFGVTFGNLEKLRKRIKTNAGLAEALWDTGNSDARMLATMVADAAAMSWEHLDTWARALDWHTLVDVFISNVALRSPHARKAVEAWAPLSAEMQSRAGWQLLAALATKTEQLADDELSVWLPRIEQGIHSAQNRVREAMNSALIAIGGRGGALRDTALEVAKRIGRVEVDHGDTACETPDAADYIEKIIARREGGVAKATALAKNAVDSVKDLAAKATAGAQNVASGAKSAVASAKNVMAGARSVVSNAQDAVSDVAKMAAEGARIVVANARNAPRGAKANGAVGRAPVRARKSGAVGKAAVSAKTRGAVGKAPASAKNRGAAGKAPASAKKRGTAGKTPASAKKRGTAGKTPVSAKKSGTAGQTAMRAVRRGPPEESPVGAKKKGAAKKGTPALPARGAAVAKRAPSVAGKASTKRGAPATARRATLKRAAPAPRKATAKRAAPTATKKTAPARSRTGAKKSARPRT